MFCLQNYKIFCNRPARHVTQTIAYVTFHFTTRKVQAFSRPRLFFFTFFTIFTFKKTDLTQIPFLPHGEVYPDVCLTLKNVVFDSTFFRVKKDFLKDFEQSDLLKCNNVKM
jgi:hypothetical protein